MKQHTLKKCYSFEGKGLHSGKYATMTIKPASEDTGIVFKRTDISDEAAIKAIAKNISSTERSTSLTENGITVMTVEHILSALTGLGVDNAVVEVNNIEIPILDGSAGPYVSLIGKDGLEEQEAERRYINISKEIEISDEKSGSYIKISPAESAAYDMTIDFRSQVIGKQEFHWDPDMDYTKEIGPCRTFVFFHEIEYLFKNNLIKGGDVDNAIVIVEYPVTDAQLKDLCLLFNKEKLEITPGGYLDNLELHFPNECCRHKMLDLIGDLRLCGGFLNAQVTAYKPGHTINTAAAKAVLDAISEQK